MSIPNIFLIPTFPDFDDGRIKLLNNIPIRELNIQYDQEKDLIMGSVSLSLSGINEWFKLKNGIDGVSTSIGVKNGLLELIKYKIGVSPGIPLIPVYGPPGFSFSLAIFGGGGEISGITQGPLRVGLNGDFSIKEPPLAPEVISKLIKVTDAGLTVQVSPFRLEGGAKVTLVDAYDIANGDLTLTTDNLEIRGFVNIADIVIAEGKMLVQWKPEILVAGSLMGKVQIPDGTSWIHNVTKIYPIPGINYPLPIFNQELILKNFSLNWNVSIWKFNLACRLDIDRFPPKFDWGINIENLNSKIFGKLISRDEIANSTDRFEGLSLDISEHNLNSFLMKGTKTTLHQLIPFKEDASQLVFRLRGETLVPQTKLILPDGSLVNPLDVAENRVVGFSYIEDIQSKEVFWIIDKPAKGDWRIEITTGTKASLDVFGFMLPLGIHITEPSSDRTSGRIEWIDSGVPDSAQISLYYDRDNQGLDGALIAQNIRPMNGKNTYIWNYDGIPAGSYFVYSIIEDGRNAPVSSYSPAKIIIPSNIAPPSSLEATVVDTSIELRWNQTTSASLQGYFIKYKDIHDTDYRFSFTVRDTNRITLNGLVPGRNYQFAISSIDTNNNLSTEMVSNVVSLISFSLNNPPIIRFRPENASKAKVGRSYSAKVESDDADNDFLLFSLLTSPAGLNINPSTGEITWIPKLDQIGYHIINIRVSDGKGGSDSLSYTINVSEPTRPSITLNRNIYSDSLSFAIVTIIDNEANRLANSVEEISVYFKSSTTLKNLICRETGANTGSFVGTLDLKSLFLFPRDTVHAVYTNLNGEEVSSFSVWETQAVAKLYTIPDSTWNFGYVTLNTFREKVIRLYNMSSFPISIISLERSGPHSNDYTVLVSGHTNISPGGFKEIFIYFRPVTPGIRNATLVINTNYGNKNLFLSGQGTSNPTYLVSGQVLAVPTDSSLSHILSGVQMTLIGQDLILVDTTDQMGNYRLIGLIDGNYEIRAFKQGYVVSPPSQFFCNWT